jgi:hypothetical protein
MAKGYPMGGGAAYNILDLPAPPRDLVVTTAPATIKVQFNAAGEEAWIVYKPGGKPRHPYDGWRVISKNWGVHPLHSLSRRTCGKRCGIWCAGIHPRPVRISDVA